jgi:hypothetical protein
MPDCRWCLRGDHALGRRQSAIPVHQLRLHECEMACGPGDVRAEDEPSTWPRQSEKLHRQVKGHHDIGVVVPKPGEHQRRIKPSSDHPAVHGAGAATAQDPGNRAQEADLGAARRLEAALEAEPGDFFAGVESLELPSAGIGVETVGRQNLPYSP